MDFLADPVNQRGKISVGWPQGGQLPVCICCLLPPGVACPAPGKRTGDNRKPSQHSSAKRRTAQTAVCGVERVDSSGPLRVPGPNCRQAVVTVGTITNGSSGPCRLFGVIARPPGRPNIGGLETPYGERTKPRLCVPGFDPVRREARSPVRAEERGRSRAGGSWRRAFKTPWAASRAGSPAAQG